MLSGLQKFLLCMLNIELLLIKSACHLMFNVLLKLHLSEFTCCLMFNVLMKSRLADVYVSPLHVTVLLKVAPLEPEPQISAVL